MFILQVLLIILKSFYSKVNRIDMKNHLTMRKTQRSNQQSMNKLKQPPSKKNVGKVKPTRKFGDDLTNIQCMGNNQQKPTKKDVFLPQLNSDVLEHYYSDIENHLLKQDLHFYSYLARTMEDAPNIKITSDMRKILIKWLIEVSNRFGCLQETLHIAIQLIDVLLVERGLAFDKTNFQLLGITALFIAFKYNEIQVPESAKFLYVCDGLYHLNDLLEMQAQILETTKFKLHMPTIYNFLHMQLKNHNIDKKCKKFIKDFSPWCLLDFNLMNNFKKSQLALLLVYFGSKVINNKSGSSFQILEESGIERKTLQNGTSLLLKLYKIYKQQKCFNQ